LKSTTMIAEILKREGTDHIFCFPVNPLIDAAAEAGIRPIMPCTERTVIGMADGYTRVSNGRRIGVCAVQNGPGIENTFGGIAQAYYKEIPENIVEDVTNKLSPDLREVLNEFNISYRCRF